MGSGKGRQNLVSDILRGLVLVALPDNENKEGCGDQLHHLPMTASSFPEPADQSSDASRSSGAKDSFKRRPIDREK
ncbi:MAG: hypothetical protein ACREIF_08115 [Chthoniobacterales bacterium]